MRPSGSLAARKTDGEQRIDKVKVEPRRAEGIHEVGFASTLPQPFPGIDLSCEVFNTTVLGRAAPPNNLFTRMFSARCMHAFHRAANFQGFMGKRRASSPGPTTCTLGTSCDSTPPNSRFRRAASEHQANLGSTDDGYTIVSVPICFLCLA